MFSSLLTTTPFYFSNFLFLFTASLALCSSSGLAGIIEMQQRYKNVASLTLTFHQKLFQQSLGTEKKSDGQIWIQRPHHFRWDTYQPQSATLTSKLISNEREVVYYTAPFRSGEMGQLLRRKATDVQSQLAIDLLSGQGNIRKNFHVKQTAPNQFLLRPKRPAGDLEHVELHLERLTNLVYKLVLLTKTGNRTELELTDTKLNSEIPKGTFEFVKPEHTEEMQ